LTGARTLARSILAAAFALALPLAAYAGGGGFGGDDDQDDAGGPPFFGIVKDDKGAPLPDTKITASIAKLNSSLVLRADAAGHFFIKGFDKSVDPADVEISCAKDGYKEVSHSASPPAGAAPIQVVCVLQHE
jgi:hypothetical protein